MQAQKMSARLLMPKRDATAREIVRRHLDGDAIAGENPDAESPHLPRGRGEQFVSVLEIDAEHRARQHVGDDALHLEPSFFNGAPQWTGAATCQWVDDAGRRWRLRRDIRRKKKRARFGRPPSR